MKVHRWLHPKITGIEAEQLLLRRGQVGSFLVRPSQSNPGDFVLSVRCIKNRIAHIRIENNGELYRFANSADFATMSELIDYYKENNEDLKVKDFADDISLKYPVNCSDPSTDRWYHGSLSAKEAEMLLMDRGRNGSYLVRESRSKPGDYVLSVRVDDNPFHVVIRNTDYQFDIGGGEKFDNLASLIEHHKENPMVATSGNVIILTQPFNATRLTALSVYERINTLDMTIDEETGRSGFWEEFEMLQEQEMRHLYSRNEGQRPENRKKNRYKNILPYDHSRVALIDGNHNDGSDYINANYVFYEISRKYEKSYIATQGTLPGTVKDFWRMVWQEKAYIIVMLTKEVEKGKTKCAVYWPQVAAVLDFDGILTVRCISEREMTDYYIRKFVLSSKNESEERIIYQYQYHAWPEHGVPASSSAMLKLIEQISKQCKEYEDAGPLVVHCSTGIGKTGTFIAIDILRSIVLEGGINVELDFQKTILAIRTQRSGLVQTQAQYHFIYRVMARFIWTLMEQIKTGEDENNINNQSGTSSQVYDLSPLPTRAASANLLSVGREAKPSEMANIPPPLFSRNSLSSPGFPPPLPKRT